MIKEILAHKFVDILKCFYRSMLGRMHEVNVVIGEMNHADYF